MNKGRLYVDGVEQKVGSFTFIMSNPEPSYGISLIPTNFAASATITVEVADREAYDRLVQLASTPTVTAQVTHSGGEPDPFWDQPPYADGWCALIRWVWRVATYPFRLSTGRTVGPWRSTVTIPNLTYRAEG